MCLLFFFFKQKTAYEMRISDWSSDVCSSDVLRPDAGHDLYVAAASRPAPDGRRLPGLDRDHGAVDRLASSADVAGADGPDGAYQLPDAIPDPEPGLPRLRPGSVREHSARAADVAVRGDRQRTRLNSS